MDILETLKEGCETVEEFTVKNLPSIMSVVASVGVFGTAVLAVKEAPEAKKRYLEAHEQIQERSARGSIKALWSGLKPMLPAIGVGMASVACILGADAIHLSRYSELSDLYTNLAMRFSDYKLETKAVLGEAGAAAVVGNIANKKDIKDIKETKNEKNRTATGEQINLFYDEFSDTFFHATWHEVLEAKLKIQDNYNENGVASLDNYYNYLGMDTPWSVLSSHNELVWDSNYLIPNWECYVGIPFSYTPENEPLYRDDGTPYYCIWFDIEPVPYQEDGNYSKTFYNSVR